MSERRTLLLSLMMAGAVCLLPVVGFVLYALWPQRVLVAWLALGLLALVVLVLLVLHIIKVGAVAKVQLAEERLRPGRLYAHERLVRDDRADGAWLVQQQGIYVQPPCGSYQQASYPGLPYDGVGPSRVMDPDEGWLP